MTLDGYSCTMASATKGELIQLGADIRERVRVFCSEHGLQDHDGVPILLGAVYYLAKHTGTLHNLATLAQFALNVWEQLDRAEDAKGRPALIINPNQPQDVHITR